jgi:two-component system LytT family response regulator
MIIRAVVADDEVLARKRIRDLLAEERDIEIIEECGDGRSAVAAILRHRPDLLFLDVEMPDLDGFGVLRAVGAARMPVVVFTTAYDKYALQAFDAHALDYLLKPFDRERFQKAMERVRFRISQERNGELSNRLLALLKDVKPEPKYLERLVIKSGGRVIFLRVDEIDYIEAAGNYLRLHLGKESHLLRETMNNIEQKLDPQKFMRIHRSSIVNIERIKELQPWFGGEYVVVMRDAKQLTLSRGYRDRLQQLLDRAM